MVESARGPLSVVVTEASVRDERLLAATADAVVSERREPTEEAPQHLCLEKGYDNRPTEELVEGRSYAPHVQRSGEAKLDEAGEKRFPARQWVVGRTLGWPSDCRAILVRYEKKAVSDLGLRPCLLHSSLEAPDIGSHSSLTSVCG